jgi:hypothetical protein
VIEAAGERGVLIDKVFRILGFNTVTQAQDAGAGDRDRFEFDVGFA